MMEEGYKQAEFSQRMFHYFAYIHQKHRLPVYPIALLSYDSPQKPEPDRYCVEFPDRRVLDFSFVTIQLNRLNWRDFLQNPNPIAAALMSKMKIKPQDRPTVKAEYLRLLATLRLDPARMRIISGFVDIYLRLNATEEQVFRAELDRIGITEQEQVMEIVTSWMETGMQQEAQKLVLQQLRSLVGNFSLPLEEQINSLSTEKLEDLSIALLGFSNESDLSNWLAQHG